ncbi:MAG: 50S ribosomal protein L23 [Dehalococcoidia bacterium]
MPKALHPYEVIKRPLITEKATILAADHKYAFRVAKAANKRQIKEAVELAFSVSVTAVNTMNMHGKKHRMGRRITRSPDWKKAIVTLAEGDSIQLFEGI